MVINVKKTFCAFRAVCPKTNMSKIVPQRYNKKNCHCQSTSIFVSLRTKIIWKSQKKSVSLHR
jgi:hypothetical protein